jgi:HD-GYP domain-containing protein (c-di-GMP phosphodiesterase class II)
MLQHSLDVHCLVKSLYCELPDDMKTGINRNNLCIAALMHDVGKVSVPLEILEKPCALTADEKELVKYHPVYGRKILNRMGMDNVADWIYYHHERVDGTGYFGLTDDKIPLESKIIAVADTFSALTLNRPYRKRSGTAAAVSIMEDAAGTQLDEKLVAIFCTMAKKQWVFERKFELYRSLIPPVIKAHFYF